MSYFSSITQNVIADPLNSSVTNLAAANAYTFAGTASTTLGVVGLQWSLITDQNATVYIEESPGVFAGVGTVTTNGTTTVVGVGTKFERDFNVGDEIWITGEALVRVVTAIASDVSLTVDVLVAALAGVAFTQNYWDISYGFDYIASKGGRGETVQASQAFWRIRVVLTVAIDTTYFRLDGVLCPIATPLPSALSEDGRLKSECHIAGQVDDRHTGVTPVGQLSMSPRYRLVGTAFVGAIIDTNFWDAVTGTTNGTVTQGAGLIELDTSAVANGTARLSTVRAGRFVAGVPNRFTSGAAFITAGTANNIRRVGAFNDDDGYFFMLSGTTFSVNSRAGGADTSVTAFNGDYGSTWDPVAGTYYKFDIEMTPLGTFFYVNNKLLHKKAGANQTETLTLYATAENFNSGGITTSVLFETVGMLISRDGELQTETKGYYATLNNSSAVLKRGAGNLHGIILSNQSTGATVDLYDGISAAGTLLWSSGPLPLKSAPVQLDFFKMPFNDGLFVVETATDDVGVMVAYE